MVTSNPNLYKGPAGPLRLHTIRANKMYSITKESTVEVTDHIRTVCIEPQKWELVLTLVKYKTTFGGSVVAALIEMGWTQSAAVVAVIAAREALKDSGSTKHRHVEYAVITNSKGTWRVEHSLWVKAKGFAKLLDRDPSTLVAVEDAACFFAEAFDVHYTEAFRLINAAYAVQVTGRGI